MKFDLILYQTLEDRSNPEEVEDNGPFKCINNKAWLGYGYYFWDAHEDLAHRWGEVNFKKNGYIICRANAELDELCWDLHGNGLHLKEFEEICEIMVENNICEASELLVYHVIEFFKSHKAFPYNSIRAVGVNPSGRDNFLRNSSYNVKFVQFKEIYLNLKPAVQVCLLTKKALNLQNYYIIYPTYYSLVYG